jgi:hypothetical protein
MENRSVVKITADRFLYFLSPFALPILKPDAQYHFSAILTERLDANQKSAIGNWQCFIS